MQGLEMHFFINYFYLIATFLEPCVMRNTKLKHNGQMCPSRPDLGIVRPPGHIRPSGCPWPVHMK